MKVKGLFDETLYSFQRNSWQILLKVTGKQDWRYWQTRIDVCGDVYIRVGENVWSYRVDVQNLQYFFVKVPLPSTQSIYLIDIKCIAG